MGKQKGEKFSQGESKEDMFNGNGVTFKCKLFGTTPVSAPRGNDICAEAIAKLKGEALLRKKELKAHKPRIFLNISVKGIRILDEKTKKLEHAHVIHRISFICHDSTDKRSFGYIVSLKEGYTLFAFRTEKAAEHITSNLKELFDVVFKMYSKKKAAEGGSVNTSVLLKDKSDVEQAQEATESTYDVPSLVKTSNLIDSDSGENDPHYKTPSTSVSFQETFGESTTSTDATTDNLLNWSDLNDNIAIMQTGMQHSDSSDLLADLTNANFDEFTPFTAADADVFSAQSTTNDNADAFGMNPFAPSSTSRTEENQSNPFANSSNENQSNATSPPAANNPFQSTSQTQSGDQNAGDLNDLSFSFSSLSHGQSTTAQPTNDIFDSAPNPTDNLLCPIVMTGGDAKQTHSNDPFASLSTNIDTIRSDLPTSGMGSPSFNSARSKSPEPVSLNSLAAASGQSRSSPQPVIPTMQMQPGYQQQPSYGVRSPYGQQPSYQMRPSANNPFANTPIANMAGYPSATGYNPAPTQQPQQSPGFGYPQNQVYSGVVTSDPLYATVDKSTPDPFAQLMSQSQNTPTKGQNQNDLAGFDLLQ